MMRFLGATGVVLLIAGGVFAFLLFAPTGPQGIVRLPVYLGSNIYEVTDALQKQGMLRSRWLFLKVASRMELDKKLRAGIYKIESPASLLQILQTLRYQKPELIQVTIREGRMAKEIAQEFERAGLADAQRFLSLVRMPQGRIRLPPGIPPQDLEGFLFPDTYRFPPLKPGSEAVIIEAMLQRFEDVIAPYADEIRRSPLSLQELVTLASLVQWEAMMDDERPIIAGVLMNRLEKRMKLQCDPTCLYALGVRKRRVLYHDLQVDSPYNTYKHLGLPPGPICSPGLVSFLAALRPAKHDYLYYVADGNGRHVFSRTLAEHERARQRWKAMLRQRADTCSTSSP